MSNLHAMYKKKQCTNLNTLRPKNSYTVVKVVPFLGLHNLLLLLF